MAVIQPQACTQSLSDITLPCSLSGALNVINSVAGPSGAPMSPSNASTLPPLAAGHLPQASRLLGASGARNPPSASMGGDNGSLASLLAQSGLSYEEMEDRGSEGAAAGPGIAALVSALGGVGKLHLQQIQSSPPDASCTPKHTGKFAAIRSDSILSNLCARILYFLR